MEQYKKYLRKFRRGTEVALSKGQRRCVRRRKAADRRTASLNECANSPEAKRRREQDKKRIALVAPSKPKAQPTRPVRQRDDLDQTPPLSHRLARPTSWPSYWG